MTAWSRGGHSRLRDAAPLARPPSQRSSKSLYSVSCVRRQQDACRAVLAVDISKHRGQSCEEAFTCKALEFEPAAERGAAFEIDARPRKWQPFGAYAECKSGISPRHCNCAVVVQRLRRVTSRDQDIKTPRFKKRENRPRKLLPLANTMLRLTNVGLLPCGSSIAGGDGMRAISVQNGVSETQSTFEFFWRESFAPSEHLSGPPSRPAALHMKITPLCRCQWRFESYSSFSPHLN